MNKNVIVYSTPTCPYCAKLKDFLKENNINFTEFDVSTDLTAAQEMTSKTGQMGVPVLDIEGEIIIGFDKEKIKFILEI